jgi:serine protease
MIFRVFPNTGCGTTCSANGSDVGLAIDNAVAAGAKVISLSLGASGPDTAEESAVANAIAAGVVVVAASGNETKTTLDYPARDPGVIAVGASALDDSTRTVTETVASYSNYDASHATTWGVVAPGGDPTGGTDTDDFHWIENISSSTSDPNFTTCTPDFGSVAGVTDCRTLIAGTSQATPHVSGAAALLLSVKPTLTPSQVFTALCTTATAIPGTTRAGCGRLNVYKAMAQVVGDSNP